MELEALSDLLTKAQQRNKRHGITGILLYIETDFYGELQARFAQAIEGPEVELTTIYDAIKRDERHHSIPTLTDRGIEKRDFEGWSMGFDTVSSHNIAANEGSFMLDDSFFSAAKTALFSVDLSTKLLQYT
jgi:hypothetical protein